MLNRLSLAAAVVTVVAVLAAAPCALAQQKPVPVKPSGKPATAAQDSQAAKAIQAAEAAAAKRPQATQAAKAPPPKLPAMTAEQIVERNVAARGGLAAWKAVQTMSWVGKMGAGGRTYAAVSPKGHLEQKEHAEVELPFKLYYKRPMKSRLELVFDGQSAVQTFDGANGWKLRPYLGRSDWEPFKAEELKQAMQEPGIDGFLIDHAAKGARVDNAGTDTIEDHAAYKLKVTRKDGQVRYVWVDAQSFLDIKTDGEPRRLDGRMHAVAVFLRNYQHDGNLMIPHLQETVVEGIPNSEKVTLEGVTLNPHLDDTLFSKGK
jgi:hypothetical protein